MSAYSYAPTPSPSPSPSPVPAQETITTTTIQTTIQTTSPPPPPVPPQQPPVTIVVSTTTTSSSSRNPRRRSRRQIDNDNANANANANDEPPRQRRRLIISAAPAPTGAETETSTSNRRTPPIPPPWIQQLRATAEMQQRHVELIRQREEEELNEALATSFESTPASFEPAPGWKIAAIKRKVGIKVKCQICLEMTGNREIIGILPCTHHFHDACIDHWLRISGVCPLCRIRL